MLCFWQVSNWLLLEREQERVRPMPSRKVWLQLSWVSPLQNVLYLLWMISKCSLALLWPWKDVRRRMRPPLFLGPVRFHSSKDALLRACYDCALGRYTPMPGMVQCIGCSRGREIAKSWIHMWHPGQWSFVFCGWSVFTRKVCQPHGLVWMSHLSCGPF